MSYSLRQIAPESKFCHDLHLDVFDQIIPISVISEVLSRCDAWEKRERDLNMVAVTSAIIAMGLLPSLSIPHVLQKMAQGLRYVWPASDISLPGASALSYRRQQLGVEPLRQLFEQVCQPRATQQTPGAFRFGLRLMAIDSTLENVPDTFANDLTFDRPSGKHGSGSWPQVRGVYLQECGTHLIVDATFGGYRSSEQRLAFALLRKIERGMLVLLDRGLSHANLVQIIRTLGAHVLGRLSSNMVATYVRQLCDGTYLAYLSAKDARSKQRPLLVRIIEYTIEDPKRVGHRETHRLVTTLLNPVTIPADILIQTYHERWEIELSIDEMDTHQRLLQRTLRSQTPDGVLQELYGILLGYYAVRALILQSAAFCDLDSDRLSFTHAITLVTNAIPEVQQTCHEHRSALMERLLADMRHPLLPVRRLRCNPRVVKSRQSKFPVRRLEHRQVPKLDKSFSDVIVLLLQSHRYRHPLPFRRFPKIALLI
jgi:Insertion element 4 transposase N-terminal/Transposase DDE domain